jgi:hypothetical protein
MITIKAYLYPNTVEVQFLDPAIFTVRNPIVYSRPVKVYQGVDNPIQLIICNQDQKPYDLTGYAVQVDIQDPVNLVTVNSYAVNFTDITRGLGTVILDKLTLGGLEQRFYKLTVKRTYRATDDEGPLYIDDNYGVPLDLEVLPAYYGVTQPLPGVDNSVMDAGIIPG